MKKTSRLRLIWKRPTKANSRALAMAQDKVKGACKLTNFLTAPTKMIRSHWTRSQFCDQGELGVMIKVLEKKIRPLKKLPETVLHEEIITDGIVSHPGGCLIVRGACLWLIVAAGETELACTGQTETRVIPGLRAQGFCPGGTESLGI